MTRKICFIYTDTNGLHKTNDFVSSKNTYKFARMIAIHYMVGTYYNDIFTKTLEKHHILKPDTIQFDEVAIKIHKITYEEAMKKGIESKIIMNELKNDLSDVDIIVSFNASFHIRAIQVECMRTAISIIFNKMNVIDMASFGHSFEFPKFTDIIKHNNIDKKKTQLEQYKELFFILYNSMKNTIKTKEIVNDDFGFVD